MVFEVEGRKLEVSSITFNAFVELSKIFDKIMSENAGQNQFKIFIGALLEIDAFMCNLVFRNVPEAKDIDWGEVDYEVIDPILAFFLNANPTLKMRLLELMKSFGFNLMELMAGLRNTL